MATRYSQPQSGPFTPSPYWLSRGLQLVFDGRRVVWSRRSSAGHSVVNGGTPKAKAVPRGIATGFGTTYGTGTSDRVDSGVLDAPRTGMRSVVAHLFVNGQGGGGLGRVFQNASGSGIANVGDEAVYLNGGGMLFVRTTSSLTGASYTTTPAFPTGRWAVFGISFMGDYPTNTPASMYIDGVSVPVTITQAAGAAFTANTVQSLSWGNRGSDSARGFDGMIGPTVVFDGNLSADEQVDLRDNPWQVGEQVTRRIWALLAGSGGGAVNLAADAAAVAAGTADLLKGVSLMGAALSVSTATAGLSHQVPLAASAVGQVSSTGQLSLTINFGATAVSSAVATALMALGKPLAAAAAAQAAGTAALDVTAGGSAVNLAAAAVSAATSGATLSLVVNLSAAAVAQATASATLGGSSALAAAAIANAQASAAMAVGKPLAAAAVGQASGGANLWLDVQLGAHALATAAAGGALSLTVNLAADALGQASAGAALSKTISLTAGGVAVATGTAALMATGPIVGNAAYVAREPRRTWTSAERRRPWTARSN